MFIDKIVIEFMHQANTHFGFLLNPLCKYISFLGEKCWFFLFVAFCFSLRKKSRWVGITIIFSILVGWILASLVIKPLVARERPLFLFYEYWIAAGGIEETEFSMPSGHTLGIVSFFTSYLITIRKEQREKIFIVAIVSILLMVFSRCYLMHHYFTDCVVGAIIGFLISYISKMLIKLVYKFVKKYENFPLFSFILNFDAVVSFKKIFTK